MVKKTDVDKQIDVTDGVITQEEAEKPDYERVYQVYEDSRIPVSKSMGKFWKARFNEIESIFKNTGIKDRWDEVIAYYQNDHGGMTNKRSRLSNISSGRTKEKKFLTENMVFANTSALVPATYAKNPDVEITPEKTGPEQEARAKLFEKLVDVLFSRKKAPGLYIKPKMKRAVLTTTLTNVSYIELAYVRKEDGSEAAIQEIEQLSKSLSEAKSIEEIAEIEGKLMALERKVNLLSPSGPCAKFRRPDMVRLDPRADGCIEDCDYIMIGDYVRTEFIRAVYGRKNDKDEWMSIYKPTHILSGEKDMQGHDDEINNFTLLNEGNEHEKYGYKDKEEFDDNCRTLVWYVWDRTTRRVLMFNDQDWSWPIWVWDDPYKLSRFYTVFKLEYTTDPRDQFARSEVMYYLDHQDELNQINDERARMRHWVSSKVFVNSNLVKDATKIGKFLNGDTEDLVHELDLPEGAKIGDMIGAFPAPSMAAAELFDTRSVIEGINRLSSVTPVLQNAQYKTNTTNKAIESYESSTQMRLDEKIDAIEELLADVANALIEMCIQFMTAAEVEALLGKEFVQQQGGWTEGMSVDEFNNEFNLRIVGGSTLKPTSKVKKEQAMNLGQVLGQFANASPMIVIVLLKMLERAYSDDVVITQEEWTAIIQATQAQMQRGSSQPGEQGQQAQQQGQQPQEGGGDVNAVMDQVAGIIDQLPPDARQFLAKGIAEGVPLKELVMQLTQAAQSNQQQRPN